MPELVSGSDGKTPRITIPWGLDRPATLGSSRDTPSFAVRGEGILARHATIVKLPESPAYVLLDHAGSGGITEVNDVPVPGFKVIRHRDVITLGHERFVFVEFQSRICAVSDADRQCAVFQHDILPGEEVVVCRCGQPTHLMCWLVSEKCPRGECSYPHHELLVKFFRDRFLFDVLTPSSQLIGMECTLRGKFPWNDKPFAPGDTQTGRVAYCPRCKMPYHEPCWFSLDVCATPDCGYEVRDRVRRFFSAKSADETNHAR